jgi:hypothetical protein
MKQFAQFTLVALALLSVATAQVTRPTDPRNIKDVRDDKTRSGMTKSSSEATGLTFATEVAKQEAITPEQAALIQKYAASITAQDLEALLTFIASDELEGRETGTRGQKLAARYLASQFMKIGLQPGNKGSWYQEYKLVTASVNSATLSLTGKEALEMGTDFVCWSKLALTESFEGEYVFAGFGIEGDDYDNLKKLDVKGKVAVILDGEPQLGGKYTLTGTDQPSEWSKGFEKKTSALQKKGARAVLAAVPDEEFKKLVDSPWLKHNLKGKSATLAYKADKNPPFPSFYISETMLNTLLKKGKTNVAAQRKALSVQDDVAAVDLSKAAFSLKSDAVKEEIVAENVLGMIEGTDKKDEVIVITAHYDHLGVRDGEVYNGADDDGTGTVSILEIAEAFMEAVKEGNRPRRTILFMPVSGEEKGLLGSEYYSDHPVFPLNKTVCNLNVDMIGRVDEKHKGEPQYIYVIGADKLSTQLHEANEKANQIVANLELDYTFNSPDDPNRFYYRSDHYNFAKHNVPVIFYFSGVHEDYHKATDDIEKILFPRTARVAQLIFATAWDVANREHKLVVDKKNDFENRR